MIRGSDEMSDLIKRLIGWLEMKDDATKQKMKWKTSYSKVTQVDAEKRLGFGFRM